MRKIILSVLSVCCAMTTQHAIAQDRAEGLYETEKNFITIEAGPALLYAKETRFFVDRQEAAPSAIKSYLDTDSNWSNGFHLAGEVGRNYEVDTWGFNQLRVSLQADWTRTRSDNSDFFYDPGAGQRYGWIELDNSNAFGTPDTVGLGTRVERQFNYGGSTLFVSGTRDLGKSMKLAIGAGPSFRRLLERNNYYGALTNGFNVTHDEMLTTNYWGGALNANISGTLSDNLKGTIGAQLGMYHGDTDYKAHQVNVSVVSDVHSASLKNSSFSYTADMKTSLTYALSDMWDLSGFGKVSYLSYVPTVNYGSVSGDPSRGVLRLEDSDLWGAAVGIALSAHF